MAALRELVAQFDIKIGGIGQLSTMNRELDRAKGGLLGNIGMLSTLGTAIASAFAIREVGSFFKQQADLGEELEKTALKTGVSIQMLQKLQYAAGQTGISAESLTGAIGKLELQLGGGMQGKGGPAIAALQKMGIHLKDAHQKTRPVVDIMEEAADKISKMDDPTKRVAASVQLFGRSGKELLPFLLKGKDGIQDLMQEAEKLGFVLGPDFVESAKKTEEEMRKMDWSWRAAKATIAQELFPIFRNFIDLVIKGVAWFKDLAKHTTIVSSALTGLSVLAGLKLFGSLSKLMGLSKGGGFLANLFGIAKLGAIIAAVAIIYLAFDDLFALFTGKKSEVGEIIDDMYGKGRSAQDVNALKDAWHGIWAAIKGSNEDSTTLADVWNTAIGLLKSSWGDFTDAIMTTITLLLRAGQAVFTFATQAKNMATGGKVDTAALATSQQALSTAWKQSNLSGLLRANPLGEIGMVVNDAAKGRFSLHQGIEATPERGFGTGTGTKQPWDAGNAPVIHQNIVVQSGDPKKIGDAVHQRTADALAQNDLRNGLNAVKSRAPAVSQ